MSMGAGVGGVDAVVANCNTTPRGKGSQLEHNIQAPVVDTGSDPPVWNLAGKIGGMGVSVAPKMVGEKEVVPKREKSVSEWNTKNLGSRLAVDAACAASAGGVVAPVIAMIDRAIIENASGKRPLLTSVKASLSTLLLRPHQFLSEKLVIDIDGDASFLMTQTELATAAEFNIGCKVIILNNEEQGMVTQWQSLFFNDRFAHTHQRNPDFVKLAEAQHVQARRTRYIKDLEKDLKWLIDESGEGPALLEVVVDQKVPVLPMVPGGSALHEFLVYDEKKERERREQTRRRSGR